MEVNSELELAAAQLAELGHPTRLGIFRVLVRAGRSGVAVGDIQLALDIPGSTLSHHISRMSKVGLMTQRRDGRTLYCSLAFETVEALLGFLYAECCIGMPQAQTAPQGNCCD
ncbi:MAG TPA: transcriptional regulator [Rheinheimera sp.]|uniref:ArsR/SmtB family transcription factor n=1 Tax=Rheinheimera sp. TaxID=1869214 RepID=UPI000EF023B9|nr:metalloregulator ArsR/SmtB family transcription factor [Rheinheimera sp.]HCU67090.1 transcriptional regulator [Rheinheimera sp.]